MNARLAPGRIRPYGTRAVLVEVGGALEAASLAAWIRSTSLPVDDVVPGASTVLIDGVDPSSVDLTGWDPSVPAVRATDTVTVPVVYDGADLAAVADLWDCSPEEVVRRHTSTTFTSAFCGFAPGFAYLAGLPAEWAVERLGRPRAAVPPGSVAIADRWCGVYPVASPGGWRLLGRTDAVLWDPGASSPALLAPGTEVHFVAARG